MAGAHSREVPIRDRELEQRIDTALFNLGVGELFACEDLRLTAVGENSRLITVTYLGGVVRQAEIDVRRSISEETGLAIVGYQFSNRGDDWRVAELVDHPITHSIEACTYRRVPESVVELLEDACCSASLVGRERVSLSVQQRVTRAAKRLGAVSLPVRVAVVRSVADKLRVAPEMLLDDGND